MADLARSSPRTTLLAAAMIAVAIFVADTVTPSTVVAAMLYVAVILFTARFSRRRGVVIATAGCAVLTVLTYLVHFSADRSTDSVDLINVGIVLAALATTAALALQAQARQTRLEEQSRLLDLTHDAIFVRRMSDNVILYWNRGAEERYGWRAAEAAGRPSHELLQTEFPAPLDEIDTELQRTDRWEGELVHTRRDMTRMTAASRWSLQRDAQGRPAAILETNNDITERAKAEYLTRHVFESSPDAICLVDADGRCERVNSVFLAFWAKSADEVVGRPVAELLGPEVFDETSRRNLERCLAGEEVTQAGWFRTPGGRSYLVVSYSPLRPGCGQVEAALMIARDLTSHVLESEALRTAHAELEHVNRIATMGQLTASVAHEVNQPIGAAAMNAKAGLRWLAREPPDLEEARLALDRVVENAKRAGEVISRIRALVKKAPPNKKLCDINDIVRDVVAVIAHEAERRGVVVRTELAADLPPIEGDRVQLQQVVLNLSMNAIEAMSGSSSPGRELRLGTLADAASGVVVAVGDSGPGLDPEGLDRLFEAFYTTKPDGMGMGLSICRSIVDAHGGRLWAEANPPTGAVFYFILPAALDAPAAAEPQPNVASR